MVNPTEADLVRAVFTGFVVTRSGTVLLRRLQQAGAATKRGKPFTKTDIYRVLNNRVYLGEAVHKGTSQHPGRRSPSPPARTTAHPSSSIWLPWPRGGARTAFAR